MDSQKFSQLLEKFILDVENIESKNPQSFEDALKDLCEFLRIARIEADIYKSVADAENKSGETIVFFSKGKHGESFCVRETLAEKYIFDYKFYQHALAKHWTDEELEKINLLEKLIYICNGHMQTTELIESLKYRDIVMDVFSVAGLIKKLEFMIESKELKNFAVIFYNITKFSSINRMLTRDAATSVMKRYVHGVIKEGGKDAFGARLGGDNFILVCKKESVLKVKRYLTVANIPFFENKKTGKASPEMLKISSKAGCLMVPEDEVLSPEEILDQVHCAYSESRNSFSENFIYFEYNLLEKKQAREKVEAFFPIAIRNEEFKVFYQPKVNMEDYSLAGAEALCRWKTGGKILFPDEFVPILEASRAICELDFYMLEHVCIDLRKWIDDGKKPVRISVNLSRCNLGTTNLLDRILLILERYRIPHNLIEIELTETAMDVDFVGLRKIVEGLRYNGINSAIDDFGCGYSSLNLMRELPWSVLKIDKSFLQQRGTETADGQKNLLGHVIAMAQEQGLSCIAEGVETLEQISFLKENNCLYAQGYYFDKPLPREKFEKLLENKS